jgi:hypothetical protein
LLGNLQDVISKLEQQKVTIDKAIAALREFDESGATGATTPTLGRLAKAVKKAAKKRVMSEEGRKRIAEASRKRWAAFKRAAKKAA